VKARFQADNDLRSSIRTGVVRREPAIDFQSAHRAQLDGVPDDEVLRLAAGQGRILVSHDQNSMPGHFGDFLAAGNRSPGVFLAPQDAGTGPVIESIVLLWIASEAEEWRDTIAWLPI
jgi:hypothetical protein